MHSQFILAFTAAAVISAAQGAAVATATPISGENEHSVRSDDGSSRPWIEVLSKQGRSVHDARDSNEADVLLLAADEMELSVTLTERDSPDTSDTPDSPDSPDSADTSISLNQSDSTDTQDSGDSDETEDTSDPDDTDDSEDSGDTPDSADAPSSTQAPSPSEAVIVVEFVPPTTAVASNAKRQMVGMFLQSTTIYPTSTVDNGKASSKSASLTSVAGDYKHLETAYADLGDVLHALSWSALASDARKYQSYASELAAGYQSSATAAHQEAESSTSMNPGATIVPSWTLYGCITLAAAVLGLAVAL